MKVLLAAILIWCPIQLRAETEEIPAEVHPFLKEVGSIVKEYSPNDIFVNGMTGSGISMCYQFALHTGEKAPGDADATNKIILKVVFPAKLSVSPRKMLPDGTLLSATSPAVGGDEIYWTLEYGRKVPADVVNAIIARLSGKVISRSP